MIARVTLDLVLEKEFDYLIPPEWEDQAQIGTRVKVPFGARQLLGTITALPPASAHPKLRPIHKMLGAAPQITPPILKLARWIAQYYCCPFEAALKSALPESVRKEKPGFKERLVARPLAPPTTAPKLTRRQSEVLRQIYASGPALAQEILARTGAHAGLLRRLEDRGLISLSLEVAARDPYAHETILATQPLPLHPEQKAALDAILRCLAQAPAERRPSVFLLHGVTGSGKTEVYLQALDAVLGRGQSAIVLVPEISLTPQTVERFKARFWAGRHQTQVAVLHSRLSPGERHDEWQKIRQGRARIVIGARSAIFAPAHPLGLIIVDEEHEPSYKQEEAPRYHARDVAVMRGQFENAVVVLGSATPSLESYANARRNKYALLEMPSRADQKKMPLVRVIDMRQEARQEKGIPILSQWLREAIQQRLEKKEQAILFLNRRGYASSLQCPKCGYVAGCPNCSIALTYHRGEQQLRCHICGHAAPVPSLCPQPDCRNPAIRFAGIGTEKVEEVLAKCFPRARVRRMDSDAMKRKEDYRRILTDFKKQKIDLLLGTQMIAKGLHFPNVTLVGIIYADLSLHRPDVRAAERTFQLLTQVAGRAGRGDVEGEVIVQAFSSFHPAIQFARRHDFAGFFEQEIEFRQQLFYPPWSRMALLTFKGRNDEKVTWCANQWIQQLRGALTSWKEIVLSGPAPAPLLRAESFYRHQILIRARQMPKLSALLAELNRKISLPKDVRLIIDIDPVNMA